MSDRVAIRQAKGSPERISVNTSVYEAVAPSMLLHEVVNDEVSGVPGCKPGDADDLVTYGGGNYVRAQASPPVAKKKKAKLVEVEVKTEPEPEPEPEADDGDNTELSSPLDLLDQSVLKLSEDIASGNYDEHLGTLLAAEEGGKTRRTAVRVLKERLAEIGG